MRRPLRYGNCPDCRSPHHAGAACAGKRPPPRVELHAENGVESSERTACGLVLFGEREDGKDMPLLAAPGKIVNCAQCRMIIDSAVSLYTAQWRRRRK